jgi:transcriptional regulator with XRE-family HTH domain
MAQDGGDDTPLGAFIRKQREVQEMSMRQLADVVGISNPYLSQIERGLREPSERVLDAIAESLQVSAEALQAQHRRARAAAGAGAGAGADADEQDGDPPVIEAIKADARLTGRQRQALIEVYSSFTGWRRPRPG